MAISRRAFIGSGSAATALMLSGLGRAASLGLPVGLQLYSVRTLLPTDYAGALKQLGAIGYKEVEAAGFFNMPVEQVKAAMQGGGLRCVSAHYPLMLLNQHLEEILPFCKSLLDLKHFQLKLNGTLSLTATWLTARQGVWL